MQEQIELEMTKKLQTGLTQLAFFQTELRLKNQKSKSMSKQKVRGTGTWKLNTAYEHTYAVVQFRTRVAAA